MWMLVEIASRMPRMAAQGWEKNSFTSAREAPMRCSAA